MDLGLKGRRALVTGASRGIGKVVADVLAREGCALALCARGKEQLSQVRDELEARRVRVFADVVDVGDPAAVRAFVEASAQNLGGLDIVVSNASPGSLKGDDSWVDSVRGDLQAFAVLAEAARPHLAGAGHGAIVAIGSTSALDVGMPSGPNSFGAIKAAVLHHASALAQAYAADGIRVNVVSPGPVEFAGGAWDQVRQGRPEVYDMVKNRVALRRFGDPAEVADAVAFLLSARASFCTGANLVVDGGLLTRVQH
ncbi:SDR family oxidoreductase [Amycolatopsis sp. K13G38]|uniref:SDR family oxidoreductase n=1 Tax=Amycolatopsis acididurans TaxID=2724524 RepID=A0ABX1J3M8_9PSEU|nr:SDR family oxidoreductase [Amycolatopsis acididurans]NKQ54269.1 SDR family oxidoreductase [Amycolatopsis acididurans]